MITEQERADLNQCAALVTEALDRLDQATALAPADCFDAYDACAALRRAHRELEARCEAARQEARGP